MPKGGRIAYVIMGENHYRLTHDLAPVATGIYGIRYEDQFISLDTNGTLILKKGFEWNGRGGDTIDPAIDTANTMRSSAVHDALYQLISKGALPKKYRKTADKIMRRLDELDGVGFIRRWYSYYLLRALGWTHV